MDHNNTYPHQVLSPHQALGPHQPPPEGEAIVAEKASPSRGGWWGLFLFLLLLQTLHGVGQTTPITQHPTPNTYRPSPTITVVQYDEEDGVPASHVTQLLQDGKGFMWFATWNGLCRYDGYEFHTFKPVAGDGCTMAIDRIRDIGLLPDGKILCRVDDDHFLFDPRTCQFVDVPDELVHTAVPADDNMTDGAKKYRQSQSLRSGHDVEWTDAFGTRWTLSSSGHLSSQTRDGRVSTHSLDPTLDGASFALADDQGNLWVLASNSICKLITGIEHTERLPIVPASEVKCLFKDHEGRCWVTTRDGAVRVCSSVDGKLTGYLGPDGQLHGNYTRLDAAVYSMYESADGTLWFGTKPDGLYRLKAHHALEHILGDANVYHITEDVYGRLWLATLGGGILYSSVPMADTPSFQAPKHYPKDCAQRVRYLYMTADSAMLAATTDGLVVTGLKADADAMLFHLHQREPDRSSSLSSSAIMDITSIGGSIFVSTESGGINQIVPAPNTQHPTSNTLLASQLYFKHYTAATVGGDLQSAQGDLQSVRGDLQSPLPTDIALSMTPMADGRLMVVGGHLVTLLDSTGHSRVLDSRYFNADYRFSDARPVELDGGRWLFGLTDGAFITSNEQMWHQTFTPRLVLTSITLQGSNSPSSGGWWSPNSLAAEYLDSITLQPNERNITVRFAALDFTAPERINYAFRLTTDDSDSDTPWNHIGHNRSVTLLDLHPGVYRLTIQSTNADGEWYDSTGKGGNGKEPNVRTLTIIVRPTFWEAWYGQLLIVLLIAAAIAVAIYTILYIRRVKRKHRETLEAYLALIKVNSEMQEVSDEQQAANGERHEMKDEVMAELDPMMQRVMAYIEENIGNSNANIGDMAAAAATSRSGLQRKLKQTMGITPIDLLREARIKHACQLLVQTDKNVSEVAYACGFTDPKYFSRCFKQSIGKTPTQFAEDS